MTSYPNPLCRSEMTAVSSGWSDYDDDMRESGKLEKNVPLVGVGESEVLGHMMSARTHGSTEQQPLKLLEHTYQDVPTGHSWALASEEFISPSHW
jgi:hypothetical protein